MKSNEYFSIQTEGDALIVEQNPNREYHIFLSYNFSMYTLKTLFLTLVSFIFWIEVANIFQ